MELMKLKLWAGVAIGVILLSGSSFVGGYVSGKSAERLAQAEEDRKQLLNAVTYVRDFENILRKDSNNASSEYQKQIESISASAAAANAELGRLRVKARTCTAALPTSNNTGKSKTTAEATAYGLGTGEVNLDGVATEIIRLGQDLDEANAKIVGLQSQADICEKATAVKPK